MFVIGSAVDIFFLADLILNFFTTYIDDVTGAEIFDHKLIIKRYLKRDFWLDLLASMPVDSILWMLNEGAG